MRVCVSVCVCVCTCVCVCVCLCVCCLTCLHLLRKSCASSAHGGSVTSPTCGHHTHTHTHTHTTQTGARHTHTNRHTHAAKEFTASPSILYLLRRKGNKTPYTHSPPNTLPLAQYSTHPLAPLCCAKVEVVEVEEKVG